MTQTQNRDIITCMVIPVYKESPSATEIQMLQRVQRYFPYPEQVRFLAPDGLNMEAYEPYGYATVYVDAKWLKSTDSYSKLMLDPEFYGREEFKEFKTMIICQTDVLLLRPWDDELEQMVQKYDYIGAPWPDGTELYSRMFKGVSAVKKFLNPRICYVGNGGLSLRNIPKTIELLNRYEKYRKCWNTGEDCFFAYYGQENDIGFRVAPVEAAEMFALESNARELITAGRIPWGVHAWEKYYPEIIKNEQWI